MAILFIKPKMHACFDMSKVYKLFIILTVCKQNSLYNKLSNKATNTRIQGHKILHFPFTENRWLYIGCLLKICCAVDAFLIITSLIIRKIILNYCDENIGLLHLSRCFWPTWIWQRNKRPFAFTKSDRKQRLHYLATTSKSKNEVRSGLHCASDIPACWSRLPQAAA